MHYVHVYVCVWNATGTRHAILFSYFKSATATPAGFYTAKHAQVLNNL
jgi:hypothetical protein